MTIEYRSLRHGDLAAVNDLMRRAMPRDVISTQRLMEYLLLEANHRSDCLLIAEHEADGVVGVMYGTCAEAGIPSDPTAGYVTLFAVDPAHQRQGIGTELLRRVTAALEARGATRIIVSGYPQAYFWPGVDVEQYPEAAAFLEKRGYTRGGTASAMHADLDAWVIEDRARELIAAREEEGYTFGTVEPEDLPEVIEFASTKLAPDWGEVIRLAVLRDRAAMDRLVIARDPQGAVVGFATYGVYGDSTERFGPFGVDEEIRGKGLGRVLLNLTMLQMRGDAAHGAWFLWTGEQTPAGQLYLSNGYEIVRRFITFSRAIDES